MAIVKFLEESYECSKAIKGDNYIHLLDDNGDLIVAFDEIASFDSFAIEDGDWATPMPEGSCYVAVIREDGTLAKGTHRCSDINRPVNLLDNSDFRNPVNQRGESSYSAVGFTLDRWKKITANGTIEPVASQSTLLIGDEGGTAFIAQQLDENCHVCLGKTYTFAVGTKDGKHYTLTATIPKEKLEVQMVIATGNAGAGEIGIAMFPQKSAPRVQIKARANSQIELVWAALYEGEYTAENLPPYVPKGYAAELAECQRYYYIIKPEEAWLSMCDGYVKETNKILCNICFPTEMRIAPTFSYGGEMVCNTTQYDTISSIALAVADKHRARLTMTTKQAVQVANTYSIICNTGTNAYLEFNADL